MIQLNINCYGNIISSFEYLPTMEQMTKFYRKLCPLILSETKEILNYF